MADIELVIKIPEEKWTYAREHNYIDMGGDELANAIINGTPLPKGHTELIDTKKLIQSVARSADNMKNNGVAPVFDAHEITNLILAQDVLIEADAGEELTNPFGDNSKTFGG